MIGCRKSADSGWRAQAGQPSVHCPAELLQGAFTVQTPTPVCHWGGETHDSTDAAAAAVRMLDASWDWQAASTLDWMISSSFHVQQVQILQGSN